MDTQIKNANRKCVQDRYDENGDLIEVINVYAIRTKEKSIWSNMHVLFYFKNKEEADNFIKMFNSCKNINIEFEHLGMIEHTNSWNIQSEIGRPTKDYVNYYYEWGVSFTKEH